MKRILSLILSVLILLPILPIGTFAAIADSEQSAFILPGGLREVSEQAFAGNTGIKTLVIPNGVTSIGAEAFEGCTGITEVTIASRTISIASDAFKNCSRDIVFYAHNDSDAMLWAMAHGYRCESLDGDSDHLARFSALVAHSGFNPSFLMSSTYASKCLIVRTPGNMDRLPDISAYNPIDIFRSDDHLYYIQFENSDEGEGNTQDCFDFLNGYSGIVVEPDIVRALDDVSAQSVTIAENWGTNDTMGFDVYAPYVAQHSSGSLTIAVIDSGVTQSSWGGNFSSAAASFVGGSVYTDSARHGSKVASILNDCLGSNKSKVTLLPIKVSTNSSLYRTSVLIEGIKHAYNNGANIINMSIGWDPKKEGVSPELERQISIANGKGIQIIAAAGNGSGEVMYPASCSGVIAVSALAYSTASGYSVRSRTGNIDYTAPGMYLGTAAYPHIDSAGDTLGMASTSFAAPQITAALALISLDTTHSGSATSVLDSCCFDLGTEGLSSSAYGRGLPQLNKLLPGGEIILKNVAGGEIPSRLWLGDKGNAFELGWDIIPDNATNKIVTISSDDDSIVTYEQTDNNSAIISAKNVGSATITITNGYDTKDVELVVEQPVTDILILGSDGTLPVGKTVQLAAAVFPQENTDWVAEDTIPSNAEINEVSWSYREYTESTSPNLEGWTQYDAYWEQTGTGTRDYATFPVTYDSSATHYSTMSSEPYSVQNDGVTKREVTNEHGGWIYWHWMYPATYTSGTNRAISDRSGYWNANGGTSGNAYNYRCFYEIKSTVDCPYLGTTYCCARNQPSYNCKSIIPSGADTSSNSGLGTDRFFRIEYFTSTYTDYQRIYKYYRDVSYSPTDPGNGDNISNKVKYVKYTYTGFSATNSSVTWASTNENVAEVTQEGFVTAKSVGTTFITCTADDGYGTKEELELTVVYQPDAEEILLTVREKEIIDGSITLEVGEAVTLEPSILPEEAVQEWTYSVYPKNVITEPQNGVIEALSSGAGKTATIVVTATTGQNVYTGLSVNVVIRPVSLSVTADDTVLDINQTTTVRGTVLPENATDKAITWSSRNASVASVNFQSGEVTAAAPGVAEIVGTTENGIQNSVTITVRQPITITFDSNGGTCGETTKQAYKDYSIGTLPTATREYYTFEGWYTSGGTKASSDSEYSGDTTLYAHWDGFPYTVTFEANGEGASCEVNAMSAKVGTKLGSLPAATWAYHTFAGWYTAPGDGTGVTEVTPDYTQSDDTDLTVFAHWVSNPYTVTFDPNGGTCATETKSAGVNTAIGILPIPERDYYIFDGWFTSRTGGDQITSEYTQSTTDGVTVYAHWTNMPYTITFDANGGNCAVTQMTCYVDTEIGDPPTTTRDYYTFDGWYIEGERPVHVTSTYKQETTNNVTATARWTPMTYTMSFDANGGVCSTDSIVGTVDSPIGDLPNPENRNYFNWLGWYTEDGTEVNNNYVQSTNADITVYAHWEGFPYTMTFDANGGNCTVSTIQGAVGTAIGALPTPTWSYHTFLGWYTAKEGGTEITSAYVQNDNDEINVYAQWNPNKYTITFNSNGGSAVSPIQRTVGTAVGELPDDPTKEYNNFNGWFMANGIQLTAEYYQDTDENITVTADWTPMQYTMVLHGNSPNNREVTIPGNSTIDPYYNTEVGSLLPTPSCEYYYFDGWYTAAVGGTAITSSYKHPSIEKIDVYAHWTPHPFTIQLNPNGGAGVATTMTGRVDTAIGSLPTPTRSGCTFKGWYDAVNGGNPIETSAYWTTPNTVTIYAHWESDWVLESEVPSGARIFATSWSYRNSTESTSSSMSGWTANGSEWRQTGTGSRDYATFPSTYPTTFPSINYGNGNQPTFKSSMSEGAYTASNNGSTKREVSNAHGGWIYWHWMYSVYYASGTNRTISDRSGTWNASGGTSGGNNYKYFYEIKSTVDCPYLSTGYCCSRGQKSYNCKNLIPSNASSRNDNGIGTDRFFRIEYFTSTYVDSTLYYFYYQDVNYSATDPGNSSNISNKVKYVKWSNNQ